MKERVRLRRADILANFDIASWREPEIQSLPEEIRSIADKRLRALKAYLLDKATQGEIKRCFGISKATFYYMVANSIASDECGDLIGYRAAIPNLHLERYCRTAKVADASEGIGVGDAGAFMQLLNEFPPLEHLMRRFARRFKPRNEGGEKRLVDYYRSFVSKCHELGINTPDYPFCRDDQGLRSFSRHLNAMRREETVRKGRQDADNADLEWLPPTEPLQELQIDGHNLGIRLTVHERDTFGLVNVHEILTVWIILVIDVYSRCVLGYNIALGRNYDQTDLLEALYFSIAPHQRPPEVISGVHYSPEGGFPSAKCPVAAWACGLIYKLDNAMAHRARHVNWCIRELVGAADDFGPPHYANDRSIVESFFHFLVDNFSNRIVGSTGSRPRDEIIKRLAPKGGDISLLLTLDELKHALDIVIADYNGRPHEGVAPYSPLELFTQAVSQKSLVFPQLHPQFREIVAFTRQFAEVKVLGESNAGAYLNFKGARYRNLSTLKPVIGQLVRVQWDPRDVSYLRVYDLRGNLLGDVFPSPPWHTPHSAKLRQRLLGLIRKKQIAWHQGSSISDLVREMQTTSGWKEREIATHNLKHLGEVVPSAEAQPMLRPPDPLVQRLGRGYVIPRGDK